MKEIYIYIYIYITQIYHIGSRQIKFDIYFIKPIYRNPIIGISGISAVMIKNLEYCNLGDFFTDIIYIDFS